MTWWGKCSMIYFNNDSIFVLNLKIFHKTPDNVNNLFIFVVESSF